MGFDTSARTENFKHVRAESIGEETVYPAKRAAAGKTKGACAPFVLL
jgi:hypothetical protein